MPEIDLNSYRSKADEALGSGGTVTLASGASAPLGTYENPKIIYVNGTLKLAGNLTGVGVIVASKGIEITGNVTYGASGSAWALLTAGSLTMAGTTQVQGSIYCHNATGTAEFIGHGTPNVLGCVVADVVTFTGDYTVEWDGGPAQIWDLPGSVVSHGPPVIETVAWKKHH